MRAARSALLRTMIVATLALSGSAVLAQRGGWNDGSGWRTGPGHSGPGRSGSDRSGGSGEGQVQISRFRIEGDAALALAHGPIAVIAMPSEADDGAVDPVSNQRFNATFEAAVEDQLVHAGYDAATVRAGGGQVAEVRVSRIEAAPAEAKHNPVSGEVSMGVSNYGTMLGVGIAIDGSKPNGALLSTRLETRIRDRTSGQVLWEGRAEIMSRAGDPRWSDQAIADKLAAALFGGFPLRLGEARERR